MNYCCFAIEVAERQILMMNKLFKAIRQNDPETVMKILCKYPEMVNCIAAGSPKKDEGQSPLQVAIKVGNIEIAHYLIIWSPITDCHRPDVTDVRFSLMQ